MKYKAIVSDLLANGVPNLPKWSKDEFVIVCQWDYGVSERTAKKVYEAYHQAISTSRASS
mgnify:CR=1 FL=1